MTSISQAKNIMRRAIASIIDPQPTKAKKQLVWDYFRSSCAFCGRAIEREGRTGHLDHLDSEGGNGLGNRVLACARCNGDEKRDRDWREFLSHKCPDAALRRDRREHIEAWVARHPGASPEVSEGVARARREAEAIVEQFSDACRRLREEVKAQDTSS